MLVVVINLIPMLCVSFWTRSEAEYLALTLAVFFFRLQVLSLLDASNRNLTSS